MDFKENKNNYYTKELNELDRYLLRIIKRYFDTEEINNATSINAIITEAIARYKEDIEYEIAGVNTVNGQTGIVNININDLDGELSFEKNSAFNLPFGTTGNTICEGNDYRLYNERQPLPHYHDTQDIPSLIENIKALREKLEIYAFHLHTNAAVLNKLKYTGTNTQIDLTELESLGSIVNMLITLLNQKIYNLISAYDSNEPTIEDLTNQIYLFMQSLYDYIESSNDNLNKLLINYVAKGTNELDSIKENIKDNYANVDEISNIKQIINNTLLLLSTEEINISDILSTSTLSGNIQVEHSLTLPEDYLVDSVEIASELVYNNTRVGMPYITDNFIISISISSSKLYIKFQPLKSSITIPSDIYNGKIICNIYSKRNIV